MKIDPSGIRTIDVLYRVSTRAQESQGDSLFNQRREVEEKWATPNGIKVRRRIEVAESGSGALRLVGNSFVFSKRAEYTELIVEYQKMRRSELPDAIAIDWSDRWSRNVLEYSGLITAFRMLGIRLLAIGDGLDLTDPRNDLVAHIRAAIGQEQLRITKGKVCEARRSRRERGKWQGGSTPDGYRTHTQECEGLVTRYRDGADGTRHAMRVRACNCDDTKLYRDPARAHTIAAIWNVLETSPLSWQAMTDDINAAGHRRLDGAPYRWNDLYRLGENPHYAGVMAFDRWDRSAHDGVIVRRKRLVDQTLIRDTGSIEDPFISEDTFWDVQRRRYGKQIRNLRRAKNGTVSELTGILVCPSCSKLMSSLTARSSSKTGHGNPRLSPPKTYIYMWCKDAQGKTPTCSNRQRVRVQPISEALIREVSRVARLSDDTIMAALQLQRAHGSSMNLRIERSRLSKVISTSNDARHRLVQLLGSGALTQGEVEQELFALRKDRMNAEDRIRDIDLDLAAEHARTDFEQARKIVTWLAETWASLTTLERAETLRLLISKASYVPVRSPYPDSIRITSFGDAFIKRQQPPEVAAENSTSRHHN